MAQLETCGACKGFLGPKSAACPHCGAPPPRGIGKIALGVLACLGGGAFAVTLMACYGCPPDVCYPREDMKTGVDDLRPGCSQDGGTSDAGTRDGGTDGGC